MWTVDCCFVRTGRHSFSTCVPFFLNECCIGNMHLLMCANNGSHGGNPKLIQCVFWSLCFRVAWASSQPVLPAFGAVAQIKGHKSKLPVCEHDDQVCGQQLRQNVIPCPYIENTLLYFQMFWYMAYHVFLLLYYAKLRSCCERNCSDRIFEFLTWNANNYIFCFIE